MDVSPAKIALRYTRPLLALAVGLVCTMNVACEQSCTVERVEPAAESTLDGSPFDPKVPAKYTLVSGDRLMIRYPTDPTLDQETRIRSDGRISLPYVGDVQAAGLAPAEIAADLNEKYKGTLKRAEVVVIVLEEAGRRVFLGGQLHAPGSLPLRPQETLSQALFEAGGVTGQGRVDQVILIRMRPNDATYVLKADLRRILGGQDPDVTLEPADLVYVPETLISQVDRFVDEYINGLTPRAVLFNFQAELKSQPVKVISNRSSNVPSVAITRQ